MSSHRGLRTIIFGLIAIMAGPALGQSLKVGGTGAAIGLLTELAPAFKADTGITLDIVAGFGTTGANSAVADGKLGLAVGGRDLRDNERAAGLRVVAVVRTPFVLVTSRPGPDSVKRTEIAQLYRADRPLWPDGTPILITLRPADESDNQVLAEFFPGMADSLRHLRSRRDLPFAATDQDNADIAEKVKGSLAAATLTQIVTEKRNLRFVAIDGIAASMENYLNGSYPYGKSLYVVVPSAPSSEARAFVAFLGKPGMEAPLRAAGIVAGK